MKHVKVIHAKTEDDLLDQINEMLKDHRYSLIHVYHKELGRSPVSISMLNEYAAYLQYEDN